MLGKPQPNLNPCSWEQNFGDSEKGREQQEVTLGSRTTYQQLSLLEKGWIGKALTAPDECFPQMKQFNTKQMPKTTPGYRVAVWEQERQVRELHLGFLLVPWGVHGGFNSSGTLGFSSSMVSFRTPHKAGLLFYKTLYRALKPLFPCPHPTF